MANGRLEARITLTSNQTGTCTNSVGATPTWTVVAGNYTPTELAAAFQAALRAVTSAFATWTVTIDSVEAGTGRSTVYKGAAGTVTVTFVTTDLRDIFGFTGNLTAVTSAQTSTNAVKGMWLPDSPLVVPTDDDAGFTYSDLRQSIGPTGAVYSLVSNLRREWRDIRWSHVSKERFIGTAAYPMSWRQFVRDTQLGTLGYFPAGARCRLYSNATTSTLLGDGQMIGVTSTEGTQSVEGWAGRWGVRIPRWVNQ